MVENTIYLATSEVAKRAGVYDTAYVTQDGRFIIDSMDIRHIRLEGMEDVTGIAGIELVSQDQAEQLISENKYRRIADMPVPDSGDEEETNEEEE